MGLALNKKAFINHQSFVLPGIFPGSSSDNWSFWQHGYHALLITDTAPLRYRPHHKTTDTPDKLNYPWFYKAVKTIESAIAALIT